MSDVTFPVPVEVKRNATLTWRVHLLRRAPKRKVFTLLLTLLFADACVWMIFSAWLPVLASTLLLLGSVRDYLFPITYTLDDEGAAAEGFLHKGSLRWEEVRRVVFDRPGVLLSPFAVPSRSDAVRGILLRPAPTGQPGDRASLRAEVARLREKHGDRHNGV